MSETERNLNDVLKAGDIAMVTTTNGSGDMSSRPLTIAAVDGGGIRFLVGTHADWIDQADHRAAVNVAVAASGRNDWVSVTGHGNVDHDRAQVDELWNPAASAYFDGKDDPTAAVLQIDVDGGEYWSAPGGGPIGRVLSVIGAALGRDTGDQGAVTTN
jgi:general stress protein 26